MHLRNDAEDHLGPRSMSALNFVVYKLLSRAIYFKNSLYSRKIASSLKMTEGYTPAILGLSKTVLSECLIKSNDEQQLRNKLIKMKHTKSQRPFSKSVFPSKKAAYYCKKGPKYVDC